MRPKTRIAGEAISQAELEEYVTLTQQLKSLKRQVREQRERLIALVEAGATVEPGRLRASIDVITQQRIGKAILVDLIGEEEYEAFRRELPPTVIRRLAVRERPGRGPKAAWGPWR